MGARDDHLVAVDAYKERLAELQSEAQALKQRIEDAKVDLWQAVGTRHAIDPEPVRMLRLWHVTQVSGMKDIVTGFDNMQGQCDIYRRSL